MWPILSRLTCRYFSKLSWDSTYGRYAFDDANTGRFQSRHLVGIVRHQAHLGNAHQLQNFGGKLKIAAIRLEAQFLVGFDRVEALVLQRVGLQLGHQADAAAFLLFVEQDAGACVGDGA